MTNASVKNNLKTTIEEKHKLAESVLKGTEQKVFEPCVISSTK